jgi:hypothetical protein
MSNLHDPPDTTSDGLRTIRLAEQAGAEHLGVSLYELQPGDEMVFHYHVQREELLILSRVRSVSVLPRAGRSFPKERSSLFPVVSAARTGTATMATSRSGF